MLTAILGLGTAVFFGAADFLGGLAAGRILAIRASALSALAGLILLTVALPIFGGTWSTGALVWGVIAGVVAACTVALLYASLAIGPMSILAPLLAVVAAIVPVAYGLASGEQLALTGSAGIVVALAAVVLVGVVPHTEAVRPLASGILLAILAGASMGTGIIVLDNTPGDSGILTLVVGRGVAVTVLLAAAASVAARGPRRSGSWRGGWAGGVRLGLAGGVLAAAADVFMLTGVRVGDVSIIGVLAALCSPITVVLAALVLRERLAPPQVVGLVLAVAAAGLFASG
ncbi:drug/metabolite transporter (DMT)-like permease [Marisediminicola sp. UYEF4]|uniref:EamA family transporter n=1 Tax=Marisediminicola sp. UYEF4 TaxID=1756384 RepID=UPI003396AC2E